MTTKTKLSADDLEWEEPMRSRIGGGYTETLCEQITEMRSALTTRRGSWAVLETCEKPNEASSRANALNKRREKRGDSRLVGLEFAGRRMLDTGGSKLYVRAAPAQSTP